METKDKALIATKGLTVKSVTLQLEQFKKGFSPLNIARAAVIGDGIVCLDVDQTDSLVDLYDKHICQGVKVVKFVPASGAATRMFKDIYTFVDEGIDNDAAEYAFNNIAKFAFCNELISNGIDVKDKKAVLNAIINAPLNYGKLPKGLIKFHNYKTTQRTALEEHLVEGAMYGVSRKDPVSVHFTVSPEHMELFKAKVNDSLEGYMQKYGVRYDVSYSIQKPSTDTIAATLDNEPFRDKNGDLVFRPAGHGALIENLNEIDGDLIFIKNIDNVQIDREKIDTVRYKKILGAYAEKMKEQVDLYINEIDNGNGNAEEIINFIESNLGYRFGKSTNMDHLRNILNRPLRVCGMVKNDGEPGGGPFWVKSKDGSESLQIAESSQISDDQKSLMQSATHFNPVDLVCIVKDHKKQKFDLRNYVDPQTGFISEKSLQGKKLKAMERPGLWNGAMSNWNTIFVEVPISTFSPVKTIVDLLRSSHQ